MGAVNTWEQAVRALLAQARQKAGGGNALALALRDAGVGPERGAYSESAVSNWIKGRTRPPADVVFAAASIYGLSIDSAVSGKDEANGATTGDGSDLARMQANIDHLADLVRQGTNSSESAKVQDVTAVYSTRSEAHAAEPMLRMVAGAQLVDVMGLSLNGLCQGISDVTLAELIEGGLTLRAMFLDPDSSATASREQEEGHPPDLLADLTRTNMLALDRVRGRLSEEARERLQVRTYLGPLRFNLLVADQRRAHVQWYLPGPRGINSPTLVLESKDRYPHGLFPVFETVFAETWAKAAP
jgi:transcriptional regulator with XRE-family HTH domain